MCRPLSLDAGLLKEKIARSSPYQTGLLWFLESKGGLRLHQVSMCIKARIAHHGNEAVNFNLQSLT